VVEEIVDAIGSTDVEIDCYPATPLQANLIAQSLTRPDAYVNQLAWTVHQTIPVEEVEKGVLRWMNAHSILRTRFVPTSHGIFQALLQEESYSANIGESLTDLCQSEMQIGFRPKDLWFRMGIVRKDGIISHLVLTIHHALYDGWCLDRLERDLLASVMGSEPDPSPPFKNVAQYIQAQDADKAQEFWTEYLLGWEGASLLNLSDPQQSNKPIVFETKLDPLSAAASRSQVTITAICKAAWALSLKTLLQTDDVVFGNVVSGRDMDFEGAQR
jgi:Condensation domain